MSLTREYWYPLLFLVEFQKSPSISSEDFDSKEIFGAEIIETIKA